MSPANAILNHHAFLQEMYEDSYFPEELVRKGEDILRELCLQIDQQKPQNLEQLYRLSHAATERFNDLQQEFEEQGSEMETAARECIAADFEAIARAYGFADADVEELIASREW